MQNFKVDFMLIGAMKCGTSTLAQILKSHPDIGFCKIKEPHFFSKTENWRDNIDKYHDLFNFKEGKIFGEASTTYTQYPTFNLEIWNDIFNYNPQMKFIYLVRNPVDRAISHYMHIYERGYTNNSIEETLRNLHILKPGLYFTQIKPFIDKFGNERVLIIDFDDLINDREALLKKISNFLEIEFNKFINYEDIHLNVSVEGNKLTIAHDKILKKLDRFKLSPLVGLLPQNTRNKLKNIFLNNSKRKFTKKPELSRDLKELVINLSILDIHELENLTNKNFSKWI